MIIIRKQILVLLFIISSVFILNAQSSCRDYHLKKCGSSGAPYKYSGQSRSATMELGESSRFKLNAFGGFEYSISVCADRNLKGIYFKIKESESSVLYDSQSEKALKKEFYMENSKMLIIEVIVPEGKKPNEKMDIKDYTGCVGVMIEYNKADK